VACHRFGYIGTVKKMEVRYYKAVAGHRTPKLRGCLCVLLAAKISQGLSLKHF
jgi:hypothetical protein